MKRLYLIRHAKSSWKYHVDDLHRPLKKRGVTDALLVAEYTKYLFQPPDKIICSPSKRTEQTAKVFLKHWKMDVNTIEFNSKVYDFSGPNLIKTIRECNDLVNNLMIFAHNFAVTDFVNTFGTLDVASVPTCGFVTIDFEIDSWKNLKPGITVFKVFPKDLK